MKSLRFHLSNLEKHGVSPQEVAECLRKGKRKYLRRAGRNKYQVIGQTTSGRYLEIVYEELHGEWFVFHAMDARRRDIRLLKRRGKGR